MNWIREQLLKRTFFDLAVLVLAAVLMVVPILVNGIPTGNDLPHHYRFALQINESLSQGVIYPSWGGTANYGLGDVGIRFYPPLSYYALNGFNAVTGDWYFASILVFFFWFLIGAIGVYLWSREWFDETSSLVAAIAFLVMPYHVNELYNAFLYAEFAGAAVLPFCFLFVTRVVREQRLSDILFLGISFAVLVLTHLPLTVIGSISLLLYGVILMAGNRSFSALPRLGLGVVLGLAVSSVYWLRMIGEMKWVRVTTEEFAVADYNFRSNFLFSFFTVSNEEYLSRTLVFSDLMALASLAAVVPCLILLFRRRNDQGTPTFLPFACLLFIGLFFATQLSLPVWSNVGMLANTQFPWRWLVIVSLAAAMLLGAAFRPLVSLFLGQWRPLAIAIFGLALIGLSFTLSQVVRPAIFSDRISFETSIQSIRNSPSCECLWPLWSTKAALEDTELSASNDAKLQFISRSSDSYDFTATSAGPASVRVPVFYYPHWHGIVNGNSVNIFPGTRGTIEVPIQAGQNEVSLRFEEPILAILGRLLSALTLIVICILFLSLFLRRWSKTPK